MISNRPKNNGHEDNKERNISAGLQIRLAIFIFQISIERPLLLTATFGGDIGIKQALLT